MAWPVHAQSQFPVRKGGSPYPYGQPVPGLGVAPPALPASVVISASDLVSDRDSRAIKSSLAADPDQILESYAPIGKGKPPAFPAPKATMFVRPAMLAPIEEPTETSSIGISGPSVAPSVSLEMPAPAVAVAAVPVPAPAVQAIAPAPKIADPVSIAPPISMPAESADRKADPMIAVPPPVDLQQSSPTVGTAAVLDPATLQKAVETYVGAEPQSIGGRFPAPEEARYKERQGVQAFYAARNFAPLWIENGTFNARARDALRRVDHAAEDGLDLHVLSPATLRGADALALANAEMAVSEAVVAYGKQASGGRIVDPSRIGALIAAKPDVADASKILATLAEAADAGEALRALNPPQKGYALLRGKLAELRQTSNVATHTAIPYGPMLKTGMRDVRVPLIRARFKLDVADGQDVEDGLVYDTQVASAVAGFQKSHHLPASGLLTIRTVAALSGGDPRRLEDDIVANMERWRWLPRDMGQNRIEVNIADFSVNVMHGDEVFHHARVVVGKPDKPTPLFSETMRFIIVNPYWNVPLSIVKKEMMPKLAADPNYFANHGYETVERDGQTYVRQPPGDSNALGRIKFMFPNQYSVYLHDTNARSLFGNDQRALSHGCVRVDAPFKFAEAVLGKENGWTEARVKRLIGGNERTINLPQPMPIHILYFTAFVDDTGALQTRDDVYGYSDKLKIALGLGRSGQIAIN